MSRRIAVSFLSFLLFSSLFFILFPSLLAALPHLDSLISSALFILLINSPSTSPSSILVALSFFPSFPFFPSPSPPFSFLYSLSFSSLISPPPHYPLFPFSLPFPSLPSPSHSLPFPLLYTVLTSDPLMCIVATSSRPSLASHLAPIAHTHTINSITENQSNLN